MKSIFGFKLLNSWQSIISTYFFVVLQHILSPMFGTSKEEIIAGRLFNIIIYSSILVLISNSIFQKRKSFIYLWILAIIPLIAILPVLINRFSLLASSRIKLTKLL